MTPPQPQTLAQAQAWLRKRIDDGERCPCCTQLAKVYRRRIHHTIARSLIDMYRLASPQMDGWVHVPTEISPACEVGKARYWGLIEESLTPRQDGGRAGWWRLTDTGERFIRNEQSIPMYARIYDGRCLGLEGDPVFIEDALGSKFNYADLMQGS